MDKPRLERAALWPLPAGFRIASDGARNESSSPIYGHVQLQNQVARSGDQARKLALPSGGISDSVITNGSAAGASEATLRANARGLGSSGRHQLSGYRPQEVRRRSGAVEAGVGAESLHQSRVIRRGRRTSNAGDFPSLFPRRPRSLAMISSARRQNRSHSARSADRPDLEALSRSPACLVRFPNSSPRCHCHCLLTKLKVVACARSRQRSSQIRHTVRPAGGCSGLQVRCEDRHTNAWG
jgi:hypothetical protein